MQTFLPLPTFEKSAFALDDQRLRKQLVEAAQILALLYRKRWDSEFCRYVPEDDDTLQTHPAVEMWRGSEDALKAYIKAVMNECERRAFRHFAGSRALARFGQPSENPKMPWWLGDERLHSSHRAALLAKDPEMYNWLGWRESPAERDESGRHNYFWPSKHQQQGGET